MEPLIIAMISSECFFKVEQYINTISRTSEEEGKRKLVGLCYEYIGRCKDLGDDFFELVYNHLHDVLLRCRDYHLLLLLDQLVRQYKTFKRLSREDCDKLFMYAFSEAVKEKNSKGLHDLKIVWRVWTYIYGDRIKNCKQSIYNKYKVAVDQLTAEDETFMKALIRKLEP